MTSRFLTTAAAAALMVGFVGSAMAGEPGPKSINTGGDKGAYHTQFCPPIPPVLTNAYFQGYGCTTSNGTPDNMARVKRFPTSLGFVQYDVFALLTSQQPEEYKDLTVVRRDIACEGLWMVTRNPDLKSLGDVIGLARRIPFILPPKDSGSTYGFSFLQTKDPDGLGRVPEGNKVYAKSATDMLEQVAASTNGAVGFFVQFADPENANIRLMVEKGLTVIPVVSREIVRARVGDESVYQVQSFSLKGDGIFSSGINISTACTPVAIITGSPAQFSDSTQKLDQNDLIDKVRGVPSEKLLPQDSRFASLLKSFKKLSSQAVEEMSAGVELAKKKWDERGSN